MNLSVIFSKAVSTLKSLGGNTALIAKKHAPELLIGTGIAGFGLTIFETVKATNKSRDILEEKERKMTIINNEVDNPNYTEVNYTNDIRNVNRDARNGLIWTWMPVVTAGSASVAAILGGFKIINGRYVATAAAYKSLEGFIERYRSNVTEAYGKDVDWRMANSIKAEELEMARKEQEENREIEADNKRRKLIKKRKKTAYQDIYNGIFDNYSDRWQRYWTPEQVLHYLQKKEDEMNDKLQINKHLFVNEVNDALGWDRTPQGQVEGWIITRNNPNSRVSFGLREMPEDELREILGTHRNEDIRVKIRLNPDGIIYNLIDKRDYLNDY